MSVLIFICFGAFFTCLFLSCLGCQCFDKALKIQYKNHNKQWEEDGRPVGFWFTPEGYLPVGFGSFTKSTAIGNHVALLWLFENPEWTKTECNARRYLFWYRVLNAVSIPIGLVAMLLFTYALNN